MAWLALAGPLVGIVALVPAWITRVFPETMQENEHPKAEKSETTASVQSSTADTYRKPGVINSGRRPGSPQFSDLVYALGRALGNTASVYQVTNWLD
jgi:hypothetical protein